MTDFVSTDVHLLFRELGSSVEKIPFITRWSNEELKHALYQIMETKTRISHSRRFNKFIENVHKEYLAGKLLRLTRVLVDVDTITRVYIVALTSDRQVYHYYFDPLYGTEIYHIYPFHTYFRSTAKDLPLEKLCGDVKIPSNL